MQIIFRRTGQRRYGIEARRPQYPAVGMDPAPGYDPLMPHDILHMVVESELGLTRGVFGQLAAGGDAGTFGRDLEPRSGPRASSRRMRRTRSRGAKLVREGHDEAAQSERATSICWHAWLARSSDPARQRLGKTIARQAQQVRATCSPAELATFTDDLIERISRRLDEISGHWTTLGVGDAVAVSWPELRVAKVAAAPPVVGKPLRDVARVVVLDANGSALLVRYDDGVGARVSYWAAPGGALEPGESHRTAAARELLEETGLNAAIGPELWQRRFDLTLPEGPVDQVERYFLVRLEAVAPPVRNSSTEAIREHRWWSLTDLEATREVIYPEAFASSLATLLKSRRDGAARA